MNNQQKLLAPAWTLALLASLSLAGCGFQTYSPKPLNAAASLTRYRAQNPNGAEFRAYLLSQGYSESDLPIKRWGLRELTLSALFFHPQLDVARAQWRAAQAAEITAGQSLEPNLSNRLEHHSDTSLGSPWTYGLAIDIPIETAGKTRIRQEIAQQQSEAARIEIAQSAWQLRSRLHNSLIDYRASLQQAQTLQQEIDVRSEIVAMLEKRLSLGMISSTEISNPRLQLQTARQALQAEQTRASGLRAALAADSGLPLPIFETLPLELDSIQPATLPAGGDLQTEALLNRLDIRAALSRYAAAEAKLRLEIARQYPDFVLSPGYAFDHGDRVWSLGISALLTLLHKNSGLIAEARALREVEAAQFEALQAQVIAEVTQAQASYSATLQELEQARQLQASQQAALQQVERQFSAGFADRLEFTSARLDHLLAGQQISAIEARLQHVAAALEDVLQRPLLTNPALPDDLQQSARQQSAKPSR